MSDGDQIKRIQFEGREHEVIHAYQYADVKLFDIWLRETATGKFTHQCCEGIDGFSLGENQLVIRDKYFGVLEEAGVVKRAGEAFEMAGRGTLHKCVVAERERVPDVYEWKPSEKDPAELGSVQATVKNGHIYFSPEIQPSHADSASHLASENSPSVFFEGRERRVIFAAFDIGHFVDIWLTDAETDKITHCCTEIDPGGRIDEYEVLVKDEFMSVLMATGLLQPRGEVVMKDSSMLHRCKMLERGFIPWLDYYEDFAKDKDSEEKSSSSATLEDGSSSVQSKLDLDDRDLGEERKLNDKNKRVQFEGREYDLLYCYFYADEDYFDFFLRDVETMRLTHQCSKAVEGVSTNQREMFVFDRYLEVLEDAGVVRPTGETLEVEGCGKMHLCCHPVRQRPALLIEWNRRADERADRSAVQAERDLDDRDLGDEFEI